MSDASPESSLADALNQSFGTVAEMLGITGAIVSSMLESLMYSGAIDADKLQAYLRGQERRLKTTNRAGALFLGALRTNLFGENDSRFQARKLQVRRERRRKYRRQFSDYRREL